LNKDRIPQLVEPRVRRNKSGKLITLLFLFFLILLAVLFFRSDLSKVDQIDIEGYRYSSLEDVGQALELTIGDPFFSVTAATLSNRIKKLPYIEEVTVKKTFPGRVSIQLTEYQEVAYLLKMEGQIEAVLSNAVNVPLIDDEPIRYLPVLSGWEDRKKELDKLCKLLRQIPAPLLADISQIKPDPTVSYPDRIRMYTRSYFEVVTTIEYLPHKLDYMRAIISEYEPGVITMLEANSHTSYSVMESNANEKEAETGNSDNS
jgi:cell division protein FtsQ